MIRLFALDVDGVLTDGTLHYGADGEVLKAFNAKDGLGLSLLMKAGVHVAVISGRSSPALLRRLDDLGIRHHRLGTTAKNAALEDVCACLDLGFEDCAFMGDDLVDLDVMRAVAYAMAPSDAVSDVKAMADFVTDLPGGRGAVREAAEHIAARNGLTLADFASDARRVSQ
ncbi:KdsC family phosphatase [Eilatimonas milleporae]|uniref:3-deoxy-D-manno-octulosonate 8-phosphate phosphatase KdsC n=1 Tax=Eilatimonas milleporae TaxID=911205 RepID=A0A3M0CSA6_9PROT|nr:HAD hydrolase family protein [Eilatimonas milleporae]RMB12471.1 3-deoxy-D-manno-octulosonate 8-phosphate phosphatase (KDO 8-P phosphatase) [Eilatimonas milleporae]